MNANHMSICPGSPFGYSFFIAAACFILGSCVTAPKAQVEEQRALMARLEALGLARYGGKPYAAGLDAWSSFTNGKGAKGFVESGAQLAAAMGAGLPLLLSQAQKSNGGLLKLGDEAKAAVCLPGVWAEVAAEAKGAQEESLRALREKPALITNKTRMTLGAADSFNDPFASLGGADMNRTSYVVEFQSARDKAENARRLKVWFTKLVQVSEKMLAAQIKVDAACRQALAKKKMAEEALGTAVDEMKELGQ